MASIAERFGITLTPLADDSSYTLTFHAERQIRDKGFDRTAVLDAANTPTQAYENGRYPGQWRHIKGDICAVVDRAQGHVVTVYANVEVTALRRDQARNKDTQQRADALAFENRRRAGRYDTTR